MQIRNLTAAALIVALSVAGCTTQTVESLSESPTPSAAPPVFASEAEALEAARAAYARYESVTDRILAEGGTRPERIAAVAIGKAYDDAIAGYETFRSEGYRLTGAPVATITGLQSHSDGIESPVVTAYLCLDIADTDVINSQGDSVIDPERPSLQSFVVEFNYNLAGDGSLALSSREGWDGNGVCDS